MAAIFVGLNEVLVIVVLAAIVAFTIGRRKKR